METLGNQHFLDNIELIHEEKVLWQGGASPRGIAVQLLHFTGFILGIILVFAVVLGIPLFLYTENPDYPSETKIEMSQPETGDALNNHQKGAQQDDEPDPPKIILSTQRVIILLGSITPLIILTLLCIAWLRVKNYWFVITTERICIQSGIFRRQLVAIDIDKVVSVIATHTILDRIFKLHAIELIHAGVNFPMPNTNLLLFNPYKMFYVPVGTNLVSKLLTNWLPRDNQKK